MCITCDNPNIDTNTLIFLDCSGCPKVLSLPQNMPNLKFLCIYNTKINIIPSCPSLEGLYMMNSQVNSLPELPKLRKLNASGSALNSIGDTCYRLESINIDNTTISSLPDTLISAITISAKNCKNLLNIPNNLLNVETLYINNSLVSEIPSLVNLEYLDISGTNIKSLPLDYLPNLCDVIANECTLDDPFAIISKGINLIN